MIYKIISQTSLCNDGSGGLIPCPERTGTQNVSFIESLIEFGLSLIFIGFIAVGVLLFVRAALNIIRGEGDEEKLQEGTQTIKGVFIGIGMLLIGLIGLVIVTSLLGAGGIFNQDDIDAPPGIEIEGEGGGLLDSIGL